LIVACSLGLTLVVGFLLTRRSVERVALADLGRQATLLAQRERRALLACNQLDLVRASLSRAGERVECPLLAETARFVPASAGASLRRNLPVQGSTMLGEAEYLYAARRVQNRALVLLRPASLRSSDWRPFAQGLLIAGLVGSLLAAAVSLFLARAITRPVHLVARASRSLAAGGSPEPVPVSGSDELAQLAASFNDMAVQLRRAKEAERAFLLSVSHELKTPLTAIRGYAEAVSDGAVEPAEAGETISVEARRLERLVQDLLDLARLNRSSFSVERHPVDLGETAREAVHRYESAARSYGVSLEAVSHEGAGALADADRLLQVVSNLVENALRSTPAGGAVRVEARRGELWVVDTGPGLAPDELPRAFERFYLFERHRGERGVGTGLGLAIVEELTQTMGGTVEVESRPGAGSTFVVRLEPAALEAPAPQRPAGARS